MTKNTGTGFKPIPVINFFYLISSHVTLTATATATATAYS